MAVLLPSWAVRPGGDVRKLGAGMWWKTSKENTLFRYTFKDPDLLRIALQHWSYLLQPQDDQRYRAMEAIGTEALLVIVLERFIMRFPNMKEGDLDQYRIQFLSKRVLANVARESGLVEKLNAAAPNAGASMRDGDLRKLLRAAVGAIYQDSKGDMNVVKCHVLPLFAHQERQIAMAPPARLIHPKGILSELAHRHSQPSPEFSVVDDDNVDYFTCTVEVPGSNWPKGTGTGGNIRSAEADAAVDLLKKLRTLGIYPGDGKQAMR